MVELGRGTRLIKSRIMKWAGRVARMGLKGEVYTGFRCGNLREMRHLKDPGVDGRIKLRGILKKWDRGMDCIVMAQDRGSLRAFVDVVMNFPFI